MRKLVLGAALALGACSGDAPPNGQEPSRSTSPSPSPSATPGAVPAALIGDWALAPADCASGERMLQIGGDQVATSGSVAQVDRVIVRPDRYVLDTSQTTGDVSTNRRLELSAAPDGRTLTRVETQRSYLYTRCPARPS